MWIYKSDFQISGKELLLEVIWKHKKRIDIKIESNRNRLTALLQNLISLGKVYNKTFAGVPLKKLMLSWANPYM